jgi:hypothetical protein
MSRNCLSCKHLKKAVNWHFCFSKGALIDTELEKENTCPDWNREATKWVLKYESETVFPKELNDLFRSYTDWLPKIANEPDKQLLGIGHVLSQMIIWFSDHTKIQED